MWRLAAFWRSASCGYWADKSKSVKEELSCKQSPFETAMRASPDSI
jgi:hypothetical protein